MTVFLFLIAPVLLAGIIDSLLRHRFSFLHFISTSLSALCALVMVDLLLLPFERIHLISLDGFLTVILGRTAYLLNLILSVFIGAVFACLVKDVPTPARRPLCLKTVLTHLISHLLLLLLLLLTQAYLWGKQAYPHVNLEEIFFYLRMPLQGTSSAFTSQVLTNVILPVSIGFLSLEFLMLYSGKSSRCFTLTDHFRVFLFPLRIPTVPVCTFFLIWFSLLLYVGNQYLDIQTYLKSHFSTSELIEAEYVSPASVALTFPENKRNLITIYIESGETTPQDTANGGILENNLIPEMTRIARENISFSRSELLEGASVAPGCGWTIAGLVAQSAGIPLKLYDTKQPNGELGDNADNSASSYESLLPGAVTLGDILADQGYQNVFMAGSDFTFGGRRVYYSQHGDYEIWDLLTAYETGALPEDYYEYWGFEDRKLYAYAKSKLSELSQSSQPFHFAMLTVDTHAPGYRCPECPTDHINAERDSLHYADMLRCSSIQLDEFLTWCKTQDFYDNTTIVVTGDHASMQSYFYAGYSNAEYDKKRGSSNRLVYNAFINSAAKPVMQSNRIFTTMDFFPTVLASMGVQIEGDRLGLGTNLFSEKPTLSEKYGEETLFTELNKRSVFYEDMLLYP